MSLPCLDPTCPSPFSARVRDAFGRQAAVYEGQARLQRGVAWRLARLCRDLPLADGPRADLGAGSGLLSRALLHHWGALRQAPPLQLDLCPALLARNPLATVPAGKTPAAAGLVWDLELGLPPRLEGAALLASGFALQWLEAPGSQVSHWCRHLAPGGWLVLAVPTAGSFPQWRQAAAAAGVRCTALALPPAEQLLACTTAAGMEVLHGGRLRFSRPGRGGLPALRELRRLGAGTSRTPGLTVAQLHRLLAHWPPGAALTWEVSLIVARRS